MKFLYKYTSNMRYICILLHIILHSSKAQRRIVDGKPPKLDRNYLVYLIKASNQVDYDTWLCGGAIVTTSLIITSAACVEDVEYIYAIAGYKKYVYYEEIEIDECTKDTKRKIVYKCLPKEYKFDYPEINKWANIDIALVKVDKPYDFSDHEHWTFCSYTPNTIDVNYKLSSQNPGMNAIVFGWGHKKIWRNKTDLKDYNSDELLYGSVTLAEKSECKKHYEDERFQNIIEKYMICSINQGLVTDEGDDIHDANSKNAYVKNCGPSELRVGDECVPVRHKYTGDLTRRRGICQNDHGGPIITWKGPKEILIGIASAFIVKDGICTAPYLYTSTHCNGEFIHCLITDPGAWESWDSQWDEEKTRRCDKLVLRSGIKIERRSISWTGHPDGPAYNETNYQGGKQ